MQCERFMAGMKLLSVDDIIIMKYCNATLGNPSVNKTIEYAPQTQSNAILEHIKLRSMQNNAKQCHPPPSTLSAPHSFHLQRESYFLPPRSSATRFPEWGHQRVWVFTNSADQDHVSKTTQPLLPFSPTSRWWWGEPLSRNFSYDVQELLSTASPKKGSGRRVRCWPTTWSTPRRCSPTPWSTQRVSDCNW